MIIDITKNLEKIDTEVRVVYNKGWNDGVNAARGNGCRSDLEEGARLMEQSLRDEIIAWKELCDHDGVRPREMPIDELYAQIKSALDTTIRVIYERRDE